jgi:Tfp pilus assembly PilM family ATPase
MGITTTTVDTYLAGRFFVGKTNPAGAGMAAAALSEALLTDQLRAWELIQAMDPNPACKQAVSDYVDQMLFDAIRVTDYFRSRNSMVPIDKVYLCGGGASIPGVAQLVRDRLGMPVQDITMPLSKILRPTKEYKSRLSAFALAIGATLVEVDG